MLQRLTITGCILFIAGVSAIAAPDDDYLRQKSLGNYDSALGVLAGTGRFLDDPVRADITLLRIYELAESAELNLAAMAALNEIESHAPSIRRDGFLRCRLDTLRSMLALRIDGGGPQGVLRERYGFAAAMDVIGPYHHRSGAEFEKSPLSPSHPFAPVLDRGRSGEAAWFPARAGSSGIINVNQLFRDLENSFVFLRSGLVAPADGTYHLYLGKTGPCDVWVGGKRVFSNRREHGFFHDQYRIGVRLSRGTHAVLIKIGYADVDGIQLSLRVADAGDLPLRDGFVELRNPPAPGFVEALSSSYFPSCETLRARSADDAAAAFSRGYLLYATGLAGKDREEVRTLLQKASASYPAPASFYLGRIETSAEQKEAHFIKCLSRQKDHVEALYELASGKIRNAFYYEAAPLVEAMETANRSSFKCSFARAKLFDGLGWTDEALFLARDVKRSALPSVGWYIEGLIHRSRKDPARALGSFAWLYARERGNRTFIDQYAQSCVDTGDIERAIDVLSHALQVYPDDTSYLLRIIELVENTRGARATLPYLSALLHRAPQHGTALLRMGLVYHKLGIRDLALQYLERAVRHDQRNISLKRYLSLIADRGSSLDDLAVRDDPHELARAAAAHRAEAAVILINENAIRVLVDGSYQTRVRKAILINDRSAIEDFARQYIVYNPETDIIEDIDCTVTNNGNRIAVTSFYDRSLSDPESRLYYDLQAKMIPLPSLGPGSIIELRYTVTSRVGEIYKGYYGERVPVGSEHRTMVYNLVLSHPRAKTVYPHVKGIDPTRMTRTTGPVEIVYRLHLRNIPPFKKEVLMPHHAEVLPLVYFTTFRNWGDVYGWYRSLVRDRAVVSEEMREALTGLIRGAESRAEKIRRIFNHVNQRIRYVGFELGIGGIQPRHADLTYHTRMGDCKDIALVLACLLREAGIDANLALVRTRDNGPVNLSVPYLGDFNHAICHVNLGGGMFLDGTSKFCGMSELPPTDRGIMALVIGERGHRFIDTGSRRYAENTDDVVNDVFLADNGDARIERTLTKGGSFAVDARSELLDREKKLKSISSYWNERYPGATIGEPAFGASAPDVPLRYRYEITVPAFMRTGGPEIVFRPFFSTSNYYSSYAMLRSRAYPLSFTALFSTTSVIRYHLPKGYSAAVLPRSERRAEGRFEADFEFTDRGDRIEVRSTFRFNAHRVSPDSYGRFRDFCRFINRKETEAIVIRKSAP